MINVQNRSFIALLSFRRCVCIRPLPVQDLCTALLIVSEMCEALHQTLKAIISKCKQSNCLTSCTIHILFSLSITDLLKPFVFVDTCKDMMWHLSIVGLRVCRDPFGRKEMAS